MTVDPAERRQLRRQFDRIDTDGSGSVEASELKALLIHATGVSSSSSRRCRVKKTQDKNGTLSFTEFCTVLQGTREGTLKFAKLAKVFREFEALIAEDDEEMGRAAPQRKAVSLGAPSHPTKGEVRASSAEAEVEVGNYCKTLTACLCSSSQLYSKAALSTFMRRLCCCLPPAVVACLVLVALPLVWIWMSLKLLFLPCFGIYFWRVFGAPQRCFYDAVAGCFAACGCACDLGYSDPHFECRDGVLSGFADSEGGGVAVDVEWKRPRAIFGPEAAEAKLFADGISPHDIDQGSLGDCWLLAAFASAAEFPGMIRRAFGMTETNWRGRYEFTLYDGAKREWVKVVVDDRIPCARGTCDPVFCKPSGSELWVCLLEKAFAKFVGGYHNLSGGFAIWALQVLTGDVAYTLQNPRAVKWRTHLGEDGDVEAFNDDTAFDMVRTYDRKGFVMTASSATEGRQDGIIGGHAYSLVTAKKIKGFKLLQLRNPWGHFEWDGDWSDGSPLWAQHPDVRKACKHDRSDDDGMFWIAWPDFLRYFDAVDVLQRSVDLHDVFLDTKDDLGCAGPLCGCLQGCAAYYCLCRGARKLCCGRTATSTATVKAETNGGLCASVSSFCCP